jgi:hypothetical protein
MAKALLLRLLLRKRTWFQLGSLAYADVPQPEAAARRLAAVSLLQVCGCTKPAAAHITKTAMQRCIEHVPARAQAKLVLLLPGLKLCVRVFAAV